MSSVAQVPLPPPSVRWARWLMAVQLVWWVTAAAVTPGVTVAALAAAVVVSSKPAVAAGTAAAIIIVRNRMMGSKLLQLDRSGAIPGRRPARSARRRSCWTLARQFMGAQAARTYIAERLGRG